MRKKVLASSPSVTRGDLYASCDLSCGHTEIAYYIKGKAPKTVKCHKCNDTKSKSPE